ncbi:MAG TPA: SgcJ/EcaC family oxidoreductase [Pseudonocardiaceae bacterium]
MSGSRATAILARHGVEEDFDFYRSFTSEEEKAALTVPQRIQEGWARNDADFFASHFVENGSLLMKDTQLTSRDEIRDYMAAGFQGPLKGARVSGWPISVKFLSDDVAMVVTQGGIMFEGQTEVAPENVIRAMWVLVDRDGEWQLFSHQSSPVKG